MAFRGHRDSGAKNRDWHPAAMSRQAPITAFRVAPRCPPRSGGETVAVGKGAARSPRWRGLLIPSPGGATEAHQNRSRPYRACTRMAAHPGLRFACPGLADVGLSGQGNDRDNGEEHGRDGSASLTADARATHDKRRTGSGITCVWGLAIPIPGRVPVVVCCPPRSGGEMVAVGKGAPRSPRWRGLFIPSPGGATEAQGRTDHAPTGRAACGGRTPRAALRLPWAGGCWPFRPRKRPRQRRRTRPGRPCYSRAGRFGCAHRRRPCYERQRRRTRAGRFGCAHRRRPCYARQAKNRDGQLSKRMKLASDRF
jgi:hypothetical protein